MPDLGQAELYRPDVPALSAAVSAFLAALQSLNTDTEMTERIACPDSAEK